MHENVCLCSFSCSTCLTLTSFQLDQTEQNYSLFLLNCIVNRNLTKTQIRKFDFFRRTAYTVINNRCSNKENDNVVFDKFNDLARKLGQRLPHLNSSLWKREISTLSPLRLSKLIPCRADVAKWRIFLGKKSFRDHRQITFVTISGILVRQGSSNFLFSIAKFRTPVIW